MYIVWEYTVVYTVQAYYWNHTVASSIVSLKQYTQGEMGMQEKLSVCEAFRGKKYDNMLSW
jgi:hypothetical protein